MTWRMFCEGVVFVLATMALRACGRSETRQGELWKNQNEWAALVEFVTGLARLWLWGAMITEDARHIIIDGIEKGLH